MNLMRRKNLKSNATQKPTSLPQDYLKMTQEVFTLHFQEGLKALAALKAHPYFEVTGQIYPDEVLLCVSLHHEGTISATTVYASCDFDPLASSPTLEELLARCVDAAGFLFGQLLDPKHPEKLGELVQDSLSALKDVPFQWAKMEMNSHTVFIKIDKSNPKIDQMTDDWLTKKD